MNGSEFFGSNPAEEGNESLPINENTISDNLRRILNENREVEYEEYGDRKVVKAGYGGKTYKFYKDSGREYSEWAMDVMDDKGEFIKSVDIREEADIKYLENIFSESK